MKKQLILCFSTAILSTSEESTPFSFVVWRRSLRILCAFCLFASSLNLVIALAVSCKAIPTAICPLLVMMFFAFTISGTGYVTMLLHTGCLINDTFSSRQEFKHSVLVFYYSSRGRVTEVRLMCSCLTSNV
jgi:hypothetical protein